MVLMLESKARQYEAILETESLRKRVFQLEQENRQLIEERKKMKTKYAKDIMELEKTLMKIHSKLMKMQ